MMSIRQANLLCLGVMVLFASPLAQARTMSPIVREARAQLSQLAPLAAMLEEDIKRYQLSNGALPPPDYFKTTDNYDLDPPTLAYTTNEAGGVLRFQFKEKPEMKMSPVLRAGWIKLWPLRKKDRLGTIRAFRCTTNVDRTYKTRAVGDGDKSPMVGEEVPGFEGCEFQSTAEGAPKGYVKSLSIASDEDEEYSDEDEDEYEE